LGGGVHIPVGVLEIDHRVDSPLFQRILNSLLAGIQGFMLNYLRNTDADLTAPLILTAARKKGGMNIFAYSNRILEGFTA
jgi:hypothetical protein